MLALKVWMLPDTKNGESEEIPLGEEAMSILNVRQAEQYGDWVVPSFGSTGHLVEPKRAWDNLLNRAKIDDLHIHDLRRTLGSWQARTGASLLIIGETLNHKDPKSTMIYARLNVDAVRESVESATAAMLDAAGVKKKPHNVVPLRQVEASEG